MDNYKKELTNKETESLAPSVSAKNATAASFLNKQTGNEIAGLTLYDSHIKQTETMHQRI